MKPVIFLLLLIPMFAASQVIDNFDDGNFTQNPAWSGTEEKFKINSDNRLQLNDTAEGTAYLSTGNGMLENAEWRFWVKLSFSPSSNNNARIYLASDSPDLSVSLNGYFIQLGESGSNDALELFRQNGNDLVSVCRGTEGLISSSFTLGIKVTRDDSGNWQLFADPEGGENYLPEAQGFDNTITTSSYLGFYCKYTKSNSSKMYFDNVFAGTLTIDTDPPSVVAVYPSSDSTVQVVYNEIVDKQSSENIQNYLITTTNLHPSRAQLESDGRTVSLYFADSFISGTDYNLKISDVADISGNVMETSNFTFSYYIPVEYDVVFNEIMADPTPAVGLPEYEYLELFNRTGNIINLSGWKLVVGSSEKIFENSSIAANGYLILGKSSAEPYLSEYGDFYGFSTFSLKNGGQTLELYDASGNIISKITYSDNWYGDPDKDDGGWSLEQINPDNICSEGENWKASVDINGGTPGTINSVFEQTELYPSVKQLEILADNILRLIFTQAMNPETTGQQEIYSADNSLGNPKYVYTFEDEKNRVELYFENRFQPGKEYHLTVSGNVENCMGLSMLTDTVIVFGLPDSINAGNIIINEVLFNPLGDGVDYVEIYNRSNKILDLSQLMLGAVKDNPPNPPDTTFYEIAPVQYLYPPYTYKLLTISPQKVMEQYYTENKSAFFQMEHFPTYPNDKGTVVIAKRTGEFIDRFDYSEDMHYPLLNYYDGVSLERISFDAPTNDKKNWHSASETSGFGTPGYQNSQYYTPDSSFTEITVEPEIFSPDNDGYNDVTTINYRFDSPGYSLTVFIFDQEGHLVRKLAQNLYVGTANGFIAWDGLKDDNTKAPVGIYIIFIRVFNLNGNVKEYKRTVVLATKL